MPAESENYKLLFALIAQTEIKSIDWDRVAREIGVPTKMAAQKRWQRLKQHEGLGSAGTPTSTPKKRKLESEEGSGTGEDLKESPLKRKTPVSSKKAGQGKRVKKEVTEAEDQDSGIGES